MSESVGFIGLGNMGSPMAANLAHAGVRVVARDLDRARQAAFVAAHGTAVDGTEAAAFAEVDAVVTMLPNGAAVYAAVVGTGLADVLPRGALIIDTSSSEPSATRALAAALALRGIDVADAPVSGGLAGARDGTLSIMLGADADATAQRAAAVLGPVSARIFRTGALGTGHATKGLNNYVLAAGFVAAAEALVLARRFGLDQATLVEVMNNSSGRNVATEKVIPQQVLTRAFAEGFSLALISKDVGVAAGLAEQLGVDAPLCRATLARLVEAGDELGFGTDYTEAVALWERTAAT